jgi:hypothetical protein
MFTADFLIDSVQNAKKQAVNTFVTDKKFQSELIKLVDVQTEFAKGQVKTTLSIAEAFVKNASDVVYSTFKKGA